MAQCHKHGQKALFYLSMRDLAISMILITTEEFNPVSPNHFTQY